MKVKKDVLYGRKDKEGKTLWMRVGMLIQKDNGKWAIKLDAIPTNFDGWLTIGEDDRSSPDPVKDSDIAF